MFRAINHAFFDQVVSERCCALHVYPQFFGDVAGSLRLGAELSKDSQIFLFPRLTMPAVRYLFCPPILAADYPHREKMGYEEDPFIVTLSEFINVTILLNKLSNIQ